MKAFLAKTGLDNLRRMICQEDKREAPDPEFLHIASHGKEMAYLSGLHLWLDISAARAASNLEKTDILIEL
jgi:hypothetical protein